MSTPSHAAAGVAASAPTEPPSLGRWVRESLFGTLKTHGLSTLKYMGETEVHTYAFSVAANAILAFFPALVLMATISTKVLHSDYMRRAMQNLIVAYLPSNQKFIYSVVFDRASEFKVGLFSCIMLFITCTGVFLPLEVALNRIWQSKSDRSYLMNQVVSLGLALGCATLIMLSIMGTALVLAPASHLTGFVNDHVGTGFVGTFLGNINGGIAFLAMKAFALVASILVFFLIYWLLPNAKVPPAAVLPAAIITGVVFEFARQIFVWCLPLLDFKETYGPFAVSVTLVFWSYVCGLLMLGGAHLSAVGQVAEMEAAAKQASEKTQAAS